MEKTMGMAENSKSVVDRKENKQRNFAESETKHFVRNHNKNAIFRTSDESTSIFGENLEEQGRKGNPYEVDGRHQKCTGLSVNDLNQLVKDRKK